MRPTSFPVSFVDLIRLLRVKGRGDKRQAKILVLLLRVKNSMLRAARVARPRQGEEAIPIDPHPGRLEGGVIAKVTFSLRHSQRDFLDLRPEEFGLQFSRLGVILEETPRLPIHPF